MTPVATDGAVHVAVRPPSRAVTLVMSGAAAEPEAVIVADDDGAPEPLLLIAITWNSYVVPPESEFAL